MQLYTNSWAEANCLARWSGTWKECNWKIGDDEVWEKYVDRPIKIGEEYGGIWIPYIYSPKIDLSRKGF